jgi:hypothetical protein
VLSTLAFLAATVSWGVLLSTRLGSRFERSERLALGAAFGLALLLWVPYLLSLVLGIQKGSLAAIALVFWLLFLEARAQRLTVARLVALAREIATSLVRDREARRLALVFLGFFLLMCRLVVTHFFDEKADGFYSSGPVHDDLTYHAALATTFLHAGNLHPTEYPFFPGRPLGYHFLSDFFTATILARGVGIAATFRLTSLLALSTLFLLAFHLARRWSGSAKIAYLALALFFFAGGLGVAVLIDRALEYQDLEFALWFDPTYEWPKELCYNVLGAVLLPARAALFGMTVTLAALTLLDRAQWEQGSRGELVLGGVLGGLLPCVHAHSFLAFSIAAGTWALLAPRRWRRALFALIPFAVLAIPQVAWIAHALTETHDYMRVQLGWLSDMSSVDSVRFWLWNAGIFLVLVTPGFFAAPSLLRKRTLPFLLVFVLGNVVVFTPLPFDNLKLFIYFQLAGAILVARLLAGLAAAGRASRIFAGVLLVLATLSGALGVLSETVREEGIFLRHDEVAFAELVQSLTPPDAVILTSSAKHHPVTMLSGRRVVLGNQWLLGCEGVPYWERTPEVKAMFEGAPEAPDLLEHYHVSYVVIGPDERAEFPGLDEAFFARRALSSTTSGDRTLYRIK